MITSIICITTGTFFTMWLGEKINEKGIGNGNSLIIMSGILSRFIDSLISEYIYLIDKIKKFDFYMKYYNYGGKEGTMCGNGGRYSVHFAKKIGIINNTNTLFKTIDGSHYASITKNIVSINMKNIESLNIKKLVEVKHICINTGSPHHILFIDNKNYLNVYNKGIKIRFNKKNLKKGVNVNFVKVKTNILNLRTYERGVENESFSCGTGVTASAIAAYNIKKLLYNKIIVQTLGGTLQVKFEKLLKSYKEIFLKGEVNFVYKGILKLPAA